MAGLLDGYGIDPLGMGLLGAGGALLTPRQQGGGIGAALQAFPQGLMQGQEMQRRMQMDAMRAKLVQSGIEENEAQAIMRKALAEKQMAEQARLAQQRAGQQDILAGIAGGQQPGFRDASIAMGGTAPPGYQPPEQRNPITQDVAARWVANGGDLDTLKKLAESGDWGRREVARVLETADAQGRPQQQQTDKFGGQVGPTFAKAYEKKFQDFGGTVGVMDPYTAQQSGSFGKTMTPGDVQQARDAAAGRGITMRGQDNTERARQAEANRPIWSQEQGAFVYRPSAAAPTGTFVQPVGPGGMPLPPKTADLAKIETDIRKELNDLPQVKKFANATPAYKAIVDAAGRNNKQADINLVYGLAKLYDPDSVVREGEYDTIAKSQTIPEWLKGQAAALTGTGGKLTAQTRALILKEAEGRFNSYRTEYDSVTTRYSEIARQRGANPENVVVPIAGDIPKGGSWSIKKVE